MLRRTPENVATLSLTVADAYPERNLISREVVDQIRAWRWIIGRGRNMPTSPVRSLIEHIRRAATPEGDGDYLE